MERSEFTKEKSGLLALLRYIDLTYPSGFPNSIVEYRSSSPIAFVLFEDEIERDLLENIVTRGMGLSMEEVTIFTITKESLRDLNPKQAKINPSYISKLTEQKTEKVVIFGEIAAKFFLCDTTMQEKTGIFQHEGINIYKAHSLTEINKDSSKKKEFWKELKLMLKI